MNTYDKAVSLIKIRPHYSAELAKKLTLRGFNRGDVEEVINQLFEQGLLNDEQFAKNYLDELIKYKTFGFYGLKAKLMQRGILANDAEKLLKENLSLEAEKQIALRVVERAGDIDKVKLMQKLSRKGFRSEVIRELIGNR